MVDAEGPVPVQQLQVVTEDGVMHTGGPGVYSDGCLNNRDVVFSWLEFLAKNNLRDIPIPLRSGGKNPAVCHKGGQWSRQNCSMYQSWDVGDKGIGLLLTDLFVLDFDDNELFEKYRRQWSPHLDECPLQKTKSGYHAVWKRNARLDDACITDKARGLVVDGNSIDIDVKTITASYMQDSSGTMRATSSVLVIASMSGNTGSDGNIKKQWVRDPRDERVHLKEVPDEIAEWIIAHYKSKRRIYMQEAQQVDDLNQEKSQRAKKRARDIEMGPVVENIDWNIVSADGDVVVLGTDIDVADISALGFEQVRVMGGGYRSRRDDSRGYMFTFRKDIACPLCHVKHNGNNAWVQYDARVDQVGERWIKGYSDNCIKTAIKLPRSPFGLQAWHACFVRSMEKMTPAQINVCTCLHARLEHCTSGWLSKEGGALYIADPVDKSYFYMIPTMNTADGTVYHTTTPWRGVSGAVAVGDIATIRFIKAMSFF